MVAPASGPFDPFQRAGRRAARATRMYPRSFWGVCSVGKFVWSIHSIRARPEKVPSLLGGLGPRLGCELPGRGRASAPAETTSTGRPRGLVLRWYRGVVHVPPPRYIVYHLERYSRLIFILLSVPDSPVERYSQTYSTVDGPVDTMENTTVGAVKQTSMRRGRLV